MNNENKIIIYCWMEERVAEYPPIVYRSFDRIAALKGKEKDYTDRYNIYVCGLLINDYQAPDTCERMLRQIENIQSGLLQEGGWAGNAWTTTVTRTGVQIDHHTVHEWDENPEGHFTLAEFKAVLQGWKQFLEMPASEDSKLEISLPSRSAND